MPSSRQLARKRQKRAAPKKGAQPVSPPLAPAPPSHVGRLNLLAFALYTAITLALGFDAILHLGDRIIGPGVGDNLWYAWSLWEGRSNVVAGQDPGHTHLIFALLPSVQIFVDAFFNEVIGWSLQTAVSPLAAYNITVLTTFVLTGFTMYLLATAFVESWLACFTAGALYNFSTFHFARAAGHFGLVTMEWMPFCVWRTFLFYRRPTWTNAALAGLGLALVPLSEIYYLPYFAVPFLGLFVAGKLIVDRHWFLEAGHVLRAGFALTLAIAIVLLPLGDYLRVDPDVGATAAQTAQGSTEQLSADLLAYVLPPDTNPLFASRTSSLFAKMRSSFPIEEYVFLGYPTILLGLLGIWLRRRSRAAWFWFVFGFAGLLLSFGPTLLVLGHSIVSLPFYSLIFSWPLLSNFRAPNRLGQIPLMALTLLAAYAINDAVIYLRRRQTSRIVAYLFAMIAVTSGLVSNATWGSLSIATGAVQVPSFYTAIARSPSGGLLLDVPPDPNGLLQYLQVTHHRLLVGGQAPRISTRMESSISNVPYLSGFLSGVPLGVQESIAKQRDIYPIAENLRMVLQEHGIRYVVLHGSDLPPLSYGWIRSFLVKSLGTPLYKDRTDLLLGWRVPRVSPYTRSSRSVNLGPGWLPGVGIYRGLLYRLVQQDAQIIVNEPRTVRGTLMLDAFTILRPDALTVRLNHATLTHVRFRAPFAPRRIHVVDVVLHKGRNVIELSVAGCARPVDVLPGNQDTRCLSFAIQRLRL